ncbi:ubiquitin-specific protease ubp2 [Emydomyces testavorans]|uniref:Ubiquitin-specific protease ubp2 n=1 Tax=Emydomyces testavorans TaxID=2070801 RepID=A0AAF0DKR3_9EURO|nr:ubiquitin-specific protease ubp2 [Emydomyces testavorans]
MHDRNRPGKTSPRFIQDVLCYDPANPPRSGFNLLTDIPPIWQNADDYPELVAPNHCDHRYLSKPNQTRLWSENGGQGRDNIYKVSAICMLCRYHLELAITYVDSRSPKPDHLHHWVNDQTLLQGDNPSSQLRSQDQRSESYGFMCTYNGCTADLTVKFLSPYLTPKLVALLSDETVLKQRMDEAVKAFPDRLEGVSHPLPITVLATLKAYIDIALNQPERNRCVGLGNKRFTTAFGVSGTPCKELLEFVGFRLKDDANCWMPPVPVTSSSLPYKDPERIFLDDISNELLALMKQRPQHEKEAYFIDLSVEAASPQFACLLGSNNYPRMHTYPIGDQTEPHPPFYQDLGATEDMSSDLILEAYRKQIQCHPERASYYFKCLRSIGQWRGEYDGRAIARFVEQQYAEGRYADDDVPDAYRFFQLDIKDTSLTDDTIIGSFFARLQDSPDEAEPRRQLWRIGDYRRSQAIKAVAEESKPAFGRHSKDLFIVLKRVRCIKHAAGAGILGR